jgi:AAA+ superfamily predicted ATPase
LYGAPGVGKSTLPYKWANEFNVPVLHTTGIRLQQLNEKGLVAREIMNLWDLANQEEKVIFILDEADLLDTDALKTFLDLLDNATAAKVLLVMVTNHASRIPEAIHSRLGEKLEISMPDKALSAKIFTYYTEKSARAAGITFRHSDFAEFEKGLQGLAPRDLEAVAKRGVAMAKARDQKVVDPAHMPNLKGIFIKAAGDKKAALHTPEQVKPQPKEIQDSPVKVKTGHGVDIKDLMLLLLVLSALIYMFIDYRKKLKND